MTQEQPAWGTKQNSALFLFCALNPFGGCFGSCRESDLPAENKEVSKG